MFARDTVIQNYGFKIKIYNQWFQNFLKNVFDTEEFWCIVGLPAISRLLQRKNFIFFIFIID